MDPVVMIALEVGTNKQHIVGKYSGGKLSVELDQPAQLGKLGDLLKNYNVRVDTWPKFLQNILDLEAKLWAIDYHATPVGTTSATTIASSSFTVAQGATFPTDLEGAVLALDPHDTDHKKYTVKKDGTELNYSATKTGDSYSVETNVYKFLIQGSYADPLTIIRGILALKSIAFGITNDPTVVVAEFEKDCRKVLDAAYGTNALGDGKS